MSHFEMHFRSCPIVGPLAQRRAACYCIGNHPRIDKAGRVCSIITAISCDQRRATGREAYSTPDASSARNTPYRKDSPASEEAFAAVRREAQQPPGGTAKHTLFVKISARAGASHCINVTSSPPRVKKCAI